jgi:hypothetical protein
MTNAEKLAFKGRLKQWGLDLIGQRIRTSTEAMDAAQQAANNEEKSSAGDKYETSRAMGHLQKDMHARQLAESVKELAALHAIPIDSLYSSAQIGAFLTAGDTGFFIGIGLGKQIVDGQTILFLSPQAPLAKSLLGVKPGDSVLFNQRTTLIHDVF